MTVHIDKNEGVWTIIHSRPQAKNAVDPENAVALYDAFLKFDRDQQAQVAVFWGAGGTFCAGADLKHAASMSGPEALHEYDFPAAEHAHSIAAMGPSRLELSKPVIAAVAGAAVAGGMELAMWADLRVIEETAFMGVYCRRWGVPLVDGGTVRLPRLVGEGKALDLILTGRKVDAQEAYNIGLCEYVVAEGTARSFAEQLAADIARFPSSTMLGDRQSVKSQHGLPLRKALQNEWNISKANIDAGIQGATRFAQGKGRSGDFSDI